MSKKPATHENGEIKQKLYSALLVLVAALGLQACEPKHAYEANADAEGHTQATPATIALNRSFAEALPLDDTADFEDARRGLIAQDPSLIVTSAEGEDVWNMPAYDFIQGDFSDSANPSLWRQAKLNNQHGLFEVVPGIYQLRGFDLANMSLIEADNSWIVVDPLTSTETASRAFAFAMQHLDKKPVSAILFTHSHIDHFGGAQAIIDQLSDAEKSALRIIAPAGFIEEATSENLIAGPAMSRRAMYMYGKRLARSERGHIGSGLGKGPAFGTFTIAEPTELVSTTPTELSIDGVRFVFQYTPDSEAPAEFTFYLPDKKAFCGAELVSRNLHNLYTLRGAKVRDALAWSAYIDEALQSFDQAEVYFGSHHWPMWGNSSITRFLEQQRDVYKFIHDQSVRLLNAGHTPDEIAEQLELPESLSSAFHIRGYYGTVKHNAKAVYQNYMGWYNGNPAKLDPLPETESAKRKVRLMGGGEAILAEAEFRFAASTALDPKEVNREYRWLAELLNILVFAEPDNTAAKNLLAKVYDQLGYQAESGPWRDVYLSAAYELRHGGPREGISPSVMKEVMFHTPVEKFFDSMAVSLNAESAEGKEINLGIHFTDLDKRYILLLKNSVLRYQEAGASGGSEAASATLRITHPLFVRMLVGDAGLKETLFSEELSIDGSTLDVLGFFRLFDKQEGVFNIVTP